MIYMSCMICKGAFVGYLVGSSAVMAMRSILKLPDHVPGYSIQNIISRDVETGIYDIGELKCIW